MTPAASPAGREGEKILIVGNAQDRPAEVAQGLKKALEESYSGRFSLLLLSPGEEATLTPQEKPFLAAIGSGIKAADIIFAQGIMTWCDIMGVPVLEYRITPDQGPEQVAAAIGLIVQGMIKT